MQLHPWRRLLWCQTLCFWWYVSQQSPREYKDLHPPIESKGPTVPHYYCHNGVITTSLMFLAISQNKVNAIILTQINFCAKLHQFTKFLSSEFPRKALPCLRRYWTLQRMVTDIWQFSAFSNSSCSWNCSSLFALSSCSRNSSFLWITDCW